MKRRAPAGPPESGQRNDDPLPEWRDAGPEEWDDRHGFGVGPAAPDLYVEPLAEDGVANARDDRGSDHPAEAPRRPVAVPQEQERQDERTGSDEQVAQAAVHDREGDLPGASLGPESVERQVRDLP